MPHLTITSWSSNAPDGVTLTSVELSHEEFSRVNTLGARALSSETLTKLPPLDEWVAIELEYAACMPSYTKVRA